MKREQIPSKYIGIHPDDDFQERYFNKWSDKEKLEYLHYLEIMTYRNAFWPFFTFGVLTVIIACIIYLTLLG